ncbi:hypothetical protein [Limnoglobus roseus]|uniref:DUF3352 domain-containing protein n=1 Tax=Limnoglobus roseus TaxID=2598579 RepID=A0A5C1AHS6_9BACT|nr:hypothetical protein [Limnoglobus roseus]QEL18195.1 hypothetical protein PX52LOC_05209 [Limnoglobus roseus]
MSRILAALGLLFLTLPAVADDVPDPLRRLPKDCGFVFKIENPRQFVEGVTNLDAYQGLQQFPQMKEYLDSTQVRRFFQVVKYLETELGGPWPTLLDKVAGRGIAVGLALTTEPQPALLVIEGTDAATVVKAHTLFLAAVREENARAESKQEVQQVEFEGISVTRVGKDFYTAQRGTAVYLANKEVAMKEGLKLAAGKTRESVLDRASLAAARKLAGPHPAAWGWLDFAKIKQSQQAKDFFETTKKDIFQTVIFGSTADAARRADFITLVVDQSPTGYAVSVRLPAKRADLDPNMAIHAPMHGEPGSRPLLKPAGVIYSQSFYLDLGFLWSERKRLFNPENLKDLEKGVEGLNKVLPNTTFGKLLEGSGPYHRIVAANTGEKLYSVEPSQAIPPVAYVGSMRGEQYGDSMDSLLRAGGALAGFQTGWKMSEETHDGVTIVTFRFPEKGEPKFDDEEKLRFNAAPSFAIVGDNLIVGSTPGIVKRLIPELKKESKSAGSPVVWRASGFANGAGQLIASSPEATVTQAILTQGIGLAEAKEQTQKFAGWLKTLGHVDISIDHAAEMYEFKMAWTYGK